MYGSLLCYFMDLSYATLWFECRWNSSTILKKTLWNWVTNYKPTPFGKRKIRVEEESCACQFDNILISTLFLIWGYCDTDFLISVYSKTLKVWVISPLFSASVSSPALVGRTVSWLLLPYNEDALCFFCAANERHMVVPVKDGVLEVQGRAGGECLRLCPRHLPHVLHPVLRHLHLLHVSEEVQDQPVLPHHCESSSHTLAPFQTDPYTLWHVAECTPSIVILKANEALLLKV